MWNDTDREKPEGFGEKSIAVPDVQPARTLPSIHDLGQDRS
jgi:hypothetical protein